MIRQIKLPLLLLGTSVLSCILHNAVYGLFRVEEPIFFSLTLIFALAFFASVIYNFLLNSKKK